MNIKYYRINESELNDLPFNEGSMYFCKDSGKLYADPIGGGVHTLINDCINDDEISNSSTWSSDKINNKIKTSTPINLLDNSDFMNPVNQRGLSSYTGPGYSIDRWRSPNSNFTINIINSGVKISSTSSNSSYFIQKIEGLEGKTLTAAVCLEDGSIYTVTAVIPIEADKTITLGALALPIPDSALCIVVEGNTLLTYYQLKIGGGQQITCKWAALYEGEYTVDTLPEYRPKEYSIELAECQRYYRDIYLRGSVGFLYGDNAWFNLSFIKMRLPIPTVQVINGDNLVTKEGYFPVLSDGAYFDASTSNNVVLKVSNSLNLPNFYPVGAFFGHIALSADL